MSMMRRRACVVGPIKSKSDVASVVIGIIILWETQVQAPGKHIIRRVRSDQGKEFLSKLFKHM